MAAATPMRPVPGAYFSTPAASQNVQRRLFVDPPAASGAGAGPLGAAPPARGGDAMLQLQRQQQQQQGLQGLQGQQEELPPILKAARTINARLAKDESYPDLDSVLRPGASSDYDVQPFDSSWSPFQTVQTYQIPDQIFGLLNGGMVTTRLGLFAEIHYAWASIDSSLFLWDYTDPAAELKGYEECYHNITAVALVPPKAGVFVNEISHILVVATTSEARLLGVSTRDSKGNPHAPTLFETKMSVPRGGSDVSIIVGTETGRIFMGGDSDTDICELVYQQEERWFSSRCFRVNHTHPGWTSVVPRHLPVSFSSRNPEHIIDMVVDDTRRLLYSLSNRSTIRTYYMETPDKLTRMIEKTLGNCLSDCTHLLAERTPLLSDKTSIVSISPISAREASKLHLMAVTNTGCRLFLSATSSASYMMATSSSAAPQSMQVQFVKFPPNEYAARGQDRRSVGQGAAESPVDLTSRALFKTGSGLRFAPGYFFDTVHRPGGDVLFVSAPDVGKINGNSIPSALKYVEQASWIDIGDRHRLLAVGMSTKPFSAARQPLGFGNELAVQFDQPPSEFAVLTDDGVHIVRRRRLVDLFASAVGGTVGEEPLAKEVIRFMKAYGRFETISAALAVACGQGNDVRNGITTRALDQATADRARTAFVDFGGQPTLSETDRTHFGADNVKLSSRHDALAAYISRLVRMLWRAKVVNLTIDPAGAITVKSSIPTEKLKYVQDSIDRLRKFLEENQGLIQGLSGPSDRVGNRQEEVAVQQEHQALHGLRKLMESIAEGISFVSVLFEEKTTDIFLQLDDAARVQLRDLTYETLFSQPPGKALAKVIVKAIVNLNIASGSNVETVADGLRRRCGTFCSPDDVVIFKAQEQLQRASEQAHNANALRTFLGESLRLFEQVAGSLTPANLRSGVEQYMQLQYYAGAIQLCLRVAREKDRGNAALAWIQDGKSEADGDRKAAFDARKQVYGLIHVVLDQLEAATAGEPEQVDGRPTLAATKRREAMNVVNESDDEVFHVDLYDWYMQKGWTDRILAVDSPHVVAYLRRMASTDMQHADLLCRFYTQRGRYFEAAQVQADLARSDDFPLGIQDRIQLLSRAKANASVDTPGVGRQQQQLLIHEVTDLLEIAHIQDDLLGRLRADPRMEGLEEDRFEEIVRDLDGPIKPLSDLYNTYADQAGYHDICLLIYHAADFQNARAVAETWQNLIEDVHVRTVQRMEEQEAAQPDGGQPADSPYPYEAVCTAITNIAHRTSNDSLIFPVDALLPMVCRYATNNEQNERIGADPCWPVQLFLSLSIPHALIVRALERVFDAQEAPFTGRRRRVILVWLQRAIDGWVDEVVRRSAGKVGIAGGAGASVMGNNNSIGAGGGGGMTMMGNAGGAGVSGDGTMGMWVADLLARMDEAVQDMGRALGDRAAGNNNNNIAQQAAESRAINGLRILIMATRKRVDELVGRVDAGASFFRR